MKCLKFQEDIWNVTILGLAFLCLFLSFQIPMNANKYIFKSIEEDDPTFTVDAYVSYVSHYICYTIVNIIAPYVTMKLGPRTTMFLACFLQLVNNIQYLFFTNWMVYVGHAIRGIGVALAWNAQGRYITQNSTKETMNRNTGIFFALTNSNRILGNLYILLRFHDEHFNYNQRLELYGVMAVICFLACIWVVSLRLAIYNKPITRSLPNALKNTFKHFANKDIFLLCFMFAFAGMQRAFFVGMYSSTIAFTLTLPSIPIQRVAYSGLFAGLGGVVGGALFSVFGDKITRFGRYPPLLFGSFLHLIASSITILNLPNSSLHGKTMDEAIITSNIYLAFFCSFLYGITDSIISTQTYGLVSDIFKDKVTESHAIYRVVLAIVAGLQFLIAPFLNLYLTVSIIVMFNIVASINFYIVELRQSSKPHISSNTEMTTAPS